MPFLNMDELRSEYTQLASATQLHCDVVMGGSFGAEIALIGEAPGPEEKKKGLPFVGGAGQFMFKNLSQEGISRADCYITNVVKRQLVFSQDESSKERSKISNAEKHHWFELARWEIDQLPNVKMLVLLGGLALECFTHNHGILNWRGSVLECVLPSGRIVKCLATVNPAYCFQDHRYKLFFRFDLHKIKKVLDGRYQSFEITPHYDLEHSEVVRWLDHFEGEDLPISLDIETPDRMTTSCIGLASSIKEGICINFHNDNENIYSLEEEIDIRTRLCRLLSNPSKRFVMQNGVFDCTWLWYKDRIRVHACWFDTLLAHHTLYPSFPHDLGFLTTQYTAHPYYKDEKSDWHSTGDIGRFWTYNVKDTCHTLEIAGKLENELVKSGMDQFFFNHVMAISPELVWMNVMGVPCDVELKERIARELAIEVDSLRRKFVEQARLCTGDASYEVNPTSPAQVSKLLFRKLGLVGRGTSTVKTNLVRVKNHARTSPQCKELISILEKFRKEEKFRSTYAEGRIDEDGRARTEYKQFGTASAPGRLSSSQTSWGTGYNLQNQTKRSLEIFLADHGYNFVYFDLSQAEARYVGWDARIASWIEQFERARTEKGFDCHRALATELWGIPYEQVPAEDFDEAGNPTKRYIAKRCRHGLNYRMQADRLAEVTGLPFHEAAEAFRLYHRATPELKRWWARLEREAINNKRLYNSFGRRLTLIGQLDDEALKSIVAFRPQSSIGDHVTSVIKSAHNDPEWPIEFARVCLNIHDADIAIVRRGLEHDVARILKRHAERPIVVHADMPPLIIPAEFKFGKYESDGTQVRWSQLEKVDV